ncbi:hypothetical protein LTR64_006847 [Lithohypha guttulata]|uniref:uncharacterized protein n=1 Tax=Lithohypha guttulata TaxID=1690604 RepID=UPI002DE0C4D3|nr:hypothetical protein LTR51_004595 [Lithohypha guttulata]
MDLKGRKWLWERLNPTYHEARRKLVDKEQRKTRCDPTLPRCEPCERSNSQCEYFDSARNRIVPRRYLVDLQDLVRRLQAELKLLEKDEEDEGPDPETMARAPGMVKFNESSESRFLGPSSGIAVTRFVMNFASRNADRRTIRDVVPDRAAQEIKQTNNAESVKPTSKVYPLISSVAAPNLPNRDLMEQLLDLYNYKAQYMLPLLHEPSFRQDVDAVYEGSNDATLNFQVRMVIAISMQKLDAQYAGLADSYYLAALPYLSQAIHRKDISTLQCFALMAQYSLLTPTRTAAFWMVGLAAKLCQDLGLCNESTIDKPPLGNRPNFLEIDMRRRLFWIITSMEYGLSHSLGRPSAFGVSVENIDVRFFHLCDDRFITSQGLAAGNHPIMKKAIAIHFLKMRLLQAEIRRTLYLKKRERPITDQDPWFHKMLGNIDSWVRDTPKNDEGSGLSPAWFEGRRNTMIVMMYRPSPQIPNPSSLAAERCYHAAVFNIALQKAQVERRLIDVTWIFTQAIFMALNTVLWSISYPEIREQHPVEEVQQHISDGLAAIDLCAARWPGVRSAHQLYGNLVSACLKAYDMQSATSPSSIRSTTQGLDGNAGVSSSRISSSSVTTPSASMQGPHTPQSYTSFPPVLSPGKSLSSPYNPVANQQQNFSSPHASQVYEQQSSTQFNQSTYYGAPHYDGLSTTHLPGSAQPLPSWESMASIPFNHATTASLDMPLERPPWLAPFGEDFAQLGSVDTMMPYQMHSLNQQEQLDLLASLEQSRLPEVTAMGGDSTVFYTVGLP